MTNQKLQFSNLDARHPGVTRGLGACYDEAARVCLDRHHTPPKTIKIEDGGIEHPSEAEWSGADRRTRDAWANVIDATENGAYCLALAAIELTRGLVAVGRAETGTGADYYLGKPGETLEDLESSFRLEVSGTDLGSDAEMRSRMRAKKEQAMNGKSNLPAIASVVGFAALKIVSANVE